MSTSSAGKPAAPAQPSTGRERTFGELFADLSQQLTTLIRAEIQLATAQLAEKGKRLGAGAGLLAVAGVLGLYLLALLLATAVLVLALWLPAWAATLIVGGVLLLVILVLALLGRRAINSSKEFAPAPQEGLKEDVEAVKKGIQQ